MLTYLESVLAPGSVEGHVGLFESDVGLVYKACLGRVEDFWMHFSEGPSMDTPQSHSTVSELQNIFGRRCRAS